VGANAAIEVSRRFGNGSKNLRRAEQVDERSKEIMSVNHAQWRTRRARRLAGEVVEESPGYVEAGYALALGQAVYDRRTALGLTQAELAARAGMTQPQVSNIEGGDSVPTLPLLTRLAKALDASLTIDLDGDLAAFVFTGHEGGAPRDGRGGGKPSVA
jgi:ribosome-binding protein aMBF1 (putative translation factor)